MLIEFKLAVAWFEGNALIGGGVYSYSERRGNFNRKARDAPPYPVLTAALVIRVICRVRSLCQIPEMGQYIHS